jgi:hypothetical protein
MLNLLLVVAFFLGTALVIEIRTAEKLAGLFPIKEVAPW